MSEFSQLITPFDCTSSPLPQDLLRKERLCSENSEEMLRTMKKSKDCSLANAKKIKEIINNLDVKNPFHLIFESDESPKFDAKFKEFLLLLQETDKNAISVLHELCHNLKLEIHVQVEPKILGVDQTSKNIR